MEIRQRLKPLQTLLGPVIAFRACRKIPRVPRESADVQRNPLDQRAGHLLAQPLAVSAGLISDIQHGQ